MNNYKFKIYEPCRITFYNKNRYIILQEPSFIAVDAKSGVVQAVGEAAELYRENAAVIVGSPFKNGVVADFVVAKSLMQLFLKKADQCKLFSRPRIAVCTSVDMTPVEYQSLYELIEASGAKKTWIMEESFAVASQRIPPEYDLVIEIALL